MPDIKLFISEVMFIKGNGTKIFADTGSLFYQNSLLIIASALYWPFQSKL
jgi:hypothetical protein